MIDVPHHSIAFQLTSDLSLLTLKGIGLQDIGTSDYYYDNRIRTDAKCVIQYAFDGEGTFEIDGVSHEIRKDKAFLFEIPGNSRYYLPEHSSRWEFLYLEFSRECLPLLRKIYRMNGPVIDLPETSGIPSQMMEIYQMALDNRLNSLFENARIAYDLWMRLTEYAVTLSVSERTKVDDAKDYIDRNYYKNELNLDLVADHTGMSKYYMCKEFHKKFGVSPGKYLRELRISQACRLLMTKTDYTLQEIAEMVGYSNNNYFGKVFRAEKGISPDKYRKQSNKYDLVRTVHEMPKNIFHE